MRQRPNSLCLLTAAVAFALSASAGCIPCLLPRLARDTPPPLPERTAVPKDAPALTLVKDLDVPGEVLAVNDDYVVNVDGAKLQIRDRDGKLVCQPPGLFDVGGASNGKIYLAGPLLYVATESEKRPGKFVSEAWVVDPARKRLTPLPQLARLLKLSRQEVAFGKRFVAISQAQKLTIFDLAKRKVVWELDKPWGFTPIGFESDGRVLGISETKPNRMTPGKDVVVFNPATRSLRWRTNFPEQTWLEGGIVGQGVVVSELTRRPEDVGTGPSLLTLFGLSNRTFTFFQGNSDDTPLFLDEKGILYFARSGYLGLWKTRVLGHGALPGRAAKERTVQGPVRRIWVAPMPDELDGNVCFAPGGTMYVPTFAYFVAVGPDGHVRWRVKTSAYSPGSVVATNGVVYLGVMGSAGLRAYASDGKILWQMRSGGSEINGLALGRDGTIYVGDSGGHLHAVDPKGTEKWTRTVAVGRQAHASGPAVARDGTIYVASSRGNLHAFAPDGRLEWTFDGGIRQAGDPVVSPNGDAYFSVEETTGTRLYAVQSGGKMRWSRKCPDIVDLAVAPEGTVYFADTASLHALDARGRDTWIFQPGGQLLMAPVPGRGGTVYVSSESGKLYAVDSRGKKIWEYRTGSASSTVDGVGADGTVYATTADTLFALRVK